jgi:hypothetical protein
MVDDLKKQTARCANIQPFTRSACPRQRRRRCQAKHRSSRIILRGFESEFKAAPLKLFRSALHVNYYFCRSLGAGR